MTDAKIDFGMVHYICAARQRKYEQLQIYPFQVINISKNLKPNHEKNKAKTD